MIELITVIMLMGILGAIGASRFFDNQFFESRVYADQAKILFRYAQKLAIAQNREVFVRSEPAGFALCFTLGCPAGSLVPDPGGGNSGTSVTRTYCVFNGVYVANWACVGRPGNVAAAAVPARNEFAGGAFFFFDAMGRPHNNGDAVGAASTFATAMPITFTSGSTGFSVTIEAETGYVH
ncbi:hypothetical protein RugamoR1_02130 [Rugamonas sp. R1(2021)]